MCKWYAAWYSSRKGKRQSMVNKPKSKSLIQTMCTSFSEGYFCMAKQECIPVGCVPPTHWLYLIVSEKTEKTMHAPPQIKPCMPPNKTTHPQIKTHMHPLNKTTHAPPPNKTMHAPRSNHARSPPRSNHTHPTPPPGSNHACHPPVNRMTNWCKNITLPQTSFAGGNNINMLSTHAVHSRIYSMWSPCFFPQLECIVLYPGAE